MKIKTLIWGLEGNSGREIYRSISKDGFFEICEWVSSLEGCTYNIFDFFQVNDNIITNVGYEEGVYMHCYTNGLNTFVNMFSRHYKNYEFSYHDFIDVFNILFNKLYSIVFDKKIELIIFFNIPHEGPDYLLYLIAKKLGIRTVLLYQTLFENRFFINTTIEDYWSFDDTPDLSDFQNLKIDKTHDGSYFYMTGVTPFYDRGMNMNWKELYKSLVRRDFDRTGKLVSKSYKFRKFIKKSLEVSKEIDLERESKFVYFPLALQPELTTSAIGGIYNDQVLAIEKLARLLPEDWMVIVKENPKQTDFQRGSWFFKRINNLGNVELIDPSVSSHKLIEHCEFVSVITGTAGWEAIKGGKNALVFGSPWYVNLPGVVRYEERISLDSITQITFTHEQLEKEFSQLLTKTAKGIIDSKYIENITDFNAVRNAKSVLNSLKTFYKQCNFQNKLDHA